MSEPEVLTGPLVPTSPEVAEAGAAPPNLPQHIGRYRVKAPKRKGAAHGERTPQAEARQESVLRQDS